MQNIGDLDDLSAELGGLIQRHAPVDGDHEPGLPGVTLHRHGRVRDLPCALTRPSLVIAAQGAKRVEIGGLSYEYNASHCLVTTLDLPVMSHVTVASAEAPYLCMAMALDVRQVAVMMGEITEPRTAPAALGRAIGVSPLQRPLLDAAVRLARLMDTPADIAYLAPMVEREILYRLLSSEHGPRLRQLAVRDSGSSRIARAVEWLKEHYQEPLRIDELSQRLNMSASTFHHQFKSVTSMSPLQYQKQLRLHEARRLLLSRRHDVGSIAMHVGYESPSQFNREYSRQFGAPPLRDVQRVLAVHEGFPAPTTQAVAT
jgi:AraC-like DNA-binding protein